MSMLITHAVIHPEGSLIWLIKQVLNGLKL